MLHTWVYVSHSLLRAEEAEAAIRDIVELSRARNESLAVTGALISSGTRFAQLLEGGASELEALKESIRSDARHDEVTTVVAGPASGRLFSDWSLIYSGSSRYFGRILDKIRLQSPDQAEEAVADLMKFFREFSGRDELQAAKVLPAEWQAGR